MVVVLNKSAEKSAVSSLYKRKATLLQSKRINGMIKDGKLLLVKTLGNHMDTSVK